MSEQTLYYSVGGDPHRYSFKSMDMHALFGLEEAKVTARFMAEQYRNEDTQYRNETIVGTGGDDMCWPKKFYLYSSPDLKSRPMYSFDVDCKTVVEFKVSNGQRGR